MDDGVDLLLGQCALQECSVSHIAFNRCDRRAQDLLKPLQCTTIAIAEIIVNHDAMTRLKQSHGSVIANVASATG